MRGRHGEPERGVLQNPVLLDAVRRHAKQQLRRSRPDAAPDASTLTAANAAPDTATGSATNAAPVTASDAAPDASTLTAANAAPDAAPGSSAIAAADGS